MKRGRDSEEEEESLFFIVERLADHRDLFHLFCSFLSVRDLIALSSLSRKLLGLVTATMKMRVLNDPFGQAFVAASRDPVPDRAMWESLGDAHIEAENTAFMTPLCRLSSPRTNMAWPQIFQHLFLNAVPVCDETSIMRGGRSFKLLI